MTLGTLVSMAAPANAQEPETGTLLFRFVLTRTGDKTGTSSVDWVKSGSTVAADFDPAQVFNGTANFAIGASTANIDFLVKADSLTESAETIDVTLSNPVGCVILGAIGGYVASVDTDGSVTLTPPASAVVGSHSSFEYEIADNFGQTAVASLTLNIVSSGPATYTNGYEAMAPWAIGPDSEAMTGFPALVDITDPRLRTQANGGLVREQYKDIRFEDGAAGKLSHGIFVHDVVSGRVLALVKRSRSTTLWNSIEVYCGRQAGAVDEQDWAGATAGHHAYWDMSTGLDKTGNGRHLTLANGTVTTLFGAPAYQFNGTNSIASLTNPNGWLNATTAMTLLMDLQHDQIAVDQGFFRCGGTATGSDGSCSFMARSDASLLADATKTSLYFVGQDISISAVTTRCSVNGENQKLKTGTPQCFGYAWGSGTAQEFFTDLAADAEIAKTTAVPSGSAVVPGGPLALGAGPRAYWAGTIGIARLASSRRSDAWILAEHRNRLQPRLMLAGGAFRLPGETAPAVAFPDTATAGGLAATIDISPLTNDTGSGLSILSVGTPTNGTAVKQTASTIRYTQRNDFTGTAYIPYTIQDSLGRTSSSVVAVAVTPPAAVANGESYTVTKSVITDLSVLANDTPAGAVEIDAIISNGSLGTASISADKTKLSYSAGGTTGSDSVTYRIKVIGGVSTAQATATITVTGAASIPARLYQPPHKPLTTGDIVIWNYGQSRPAYDWTKYCLLVWPSTPVSGASSAMWNIQDAEWAGIFEIGYQLNPIGDNPQYRHSGGGTADNPYVKLEPALNGLGSMMQRSFNNNAPSGLKQPGKRPFWWCDGGRVDTCSRPGDSPGVQQSCWHGDIWKSGIKRQTSATDYQFWASDAYIIRTRVDNSNYFFSGYATATTETQTPHSDWMQNEALCFRRLFVSQFFGKLHGQGFYLTGDQSYFTDTGLPKGIIPRDAWCEFDHFHGQPMPYDSSTLFSGGHDLKYAATAQIRSTNAAPTQADYTGPKDNPPNGFHCPAARYYPVALGPEVYLQEKLGSLAACDPILGKPYNYSGGLSLGTPNKIGYNLDKRCLDAGLHDYAAGGMTSGGPMARAANYFVKADLRAPSYQMVPDSYCGPNRRVTTEQQLLDYINNGT
jgi:hypothetical protein